MQASPIQEFQALFPHIQREILENVLIACGGNIEEATALILSQPDFHNQTPQRTPISYLCDLFPHVEEKVLQELLAAKGGSVDAVIALLSGTIPTPSPVPVNHHPPAKSSCSAARAVAPTPSQLPRLPTTHSSPMRIPPKPAAHSKKQLAGDNLQRLRAAIFGLDTGSPPQTDQAFPRSPPPDWVLAQLQRGSPSRPPVITSRRSPLGPARGTTAFARLGVAHSHLAESSTTQGEGTEWWLEEERTQESESPEREEMPESSEEKTQPKEGDTSPTRNLTTKGNALSLPAQLPKETTMQSECPPSSICFHAPSDAKDVKVMGSWNQWKEGIPMQFDNNRKVWNAVVNLPPGQHHVRFVMDNNKNVTDNDLPVIVEPNGEKSNLIEVGDVSSAPTGMGSIMCEPAEACGMRFRRATLTEPALVTPEIASKDHHPEVSMGWAAIQPCARELTMVPVQLPTQLNPCDIVVKISHCGLSTTDLQFKDNAWGNMSYPAVLGHEGIGFVIRKGDRAKNINVGDRVGIPFLLSWCDVCSQCRAGKPQLCDEAKTLCIGHPGCLQDAVVVPENCVVKIPPQLDSIHAAPMISAGVSVFLPLEKYCRRSGMDVAIIGLGGAGAMAVLIAKAMGANVTVFSRSANKQAQATELGADHFVLRDVPGTMVARRKAFDLVISTTPAIPADGDTLLGMLRPDGTLVFVGCPAETHKDQQRVVASDIVISVPHLIFTQLAVTGTEFGARHDVERCLAFCAAHGIKPPVEAMPMKKVNDAIRRIEAGGVHGRIVLQAE